MLVKAELKAKDVMAADPVCIRPSATVREVARILEEHEIFGVAVTDAQGKVIGIVTKTDLIRRCSAGTDDLAPAYLFEILQEQGDEESSEVIPASVVCVEDFMTEDPLMVSPELSVGGVARLMVERRVHRVVVADDGGLPIGIIPTMDLLDALARP
ncbi:MAG: CBS domain-containing protein [Planctomycetaceae bacterium]|jgi:CBS domain-containing protein|nr:CBS domain-containing protein [Planctomycetaceae bacterium]